VVNKGAIQEWFHGPAYGFDVGVAKALRPRLQRDRTEAANRPCTSSAYIAQGHQPDALLERLMPALDLALGRKTTTCWAISKPRSKPSSPTSVGNQASWQNEKGSNDTSSPADARNTGPDISPMRQRLP
jgi:hypothetical protein